MTTRLETPIRLSCAFLHDDMQLKHHTNRLHDVDDQVKDSFEFH